MNSDISTHASLLSRQCCGSAWQGCTGSGDKLVVRIVLRRGNQCTYAAYVTEVSMFGSSFITLPRFGGVRHFESVNVMHSYGTHARKTKTVQWNDTGIEDAVVRHEANVEFPSSGVPHEE